MYARIMHFLPHAGLGAVFAYASYDMITTSKYKKSMTHQKDGKDIDLDDDTSNLIKNVMNKLALEPVLKEKYAFFVSTELDPITRGDARWRTGAIIGLPFWFHYKSPEEAKASPLLVKGQQVHVEWDSEKGHQLAEALVLGENAKAFAIARDVSILDLFLSHTDVLIQAGFVLIGSSLIHFFDKHLFARKKLPKWSRYTSATLVGLSVYMLYLGAADIYTCSKDARADMRTADLSKSFAEGGVQFYEKMIARNQALRSLMGDRGKLLFTPEGNDVHGIRTPHIPHTTRLAYLKGKLNTMEKSEK